MCGLQYKTCGSLQHSTCLTAGLQSGHRRQQPQLYILRAPDALAAAQFVWRPSAGALGQRAAGRLLHHCIGLPQCPRPYRRDGQWIRHIPTTWTRVPRLNDHFVLFFFVFSFPESV